MVIATTLASYSFKRGRLNVNIYIFFIFQSLFLFVFSALRYGIGPDYYSYQTFYYASSRGELVSFELGYSLIQNLFIYFDADFQFLVAFYSFVYTFLVSLGVYKNTKYILLSLLFIVLWNENFITSLSFIRQTIAVAIVFCGFQYFVLNKRLKYMAVVAVATLFHYSALVYVLLLFIPKYIHNKLWLIILPLVFYVLGKMGVFETVIIFVLNSSNVYSHLLDRAIFSAEPGSGLGYIISYLTLAGLLLTANKRVLEDKTHASLYLFSIAYFCLSAVSLSIPLISRLTLLFSIYPCLLLPVLIFNTRIKQKRLVLISVIGVYLILALRYFLQESFQEAYLPVKFIIET